MGLRYLKRKSFGTGVSVLLETSDVWKFRECLACTVQGSLPVCHRAHEREIPCLCTANHRHTTWEYSSTAKCCAGTLQASTPICSYSGIIPMTKAVSASMCIPEEPLYVLAAVDAQHACFKQCIAGSRSRESYCRGLNNKNRAFG